MLEIPSMWGRKGVHFPEDSKAPRQLRTPRIEHPTTAGDVQIFLRQVHKRHRVDEDYTRRRSPPNTMFVTTVPPQDDPPCPPITPGSPPPLEQITLRGPGGQREHILRKKADPELAESHETEDYQIQCALSPTTGEKRYCQPCENFKPERTHHCQSCGICVLRMDHHCPWIANCVGFRNQKFFWNFLGYSVALSALVGWRTRGALLRLVFVDEGRGIKDERPELQGVLVVGFGGLFTSGDLCSFFSSVLCKIKMCFLNIYPHSEKSLVDSWSWVALL